MAPSLRTLALASTLLAACGGGGPSVSVPSTGYPPLVNAGFDKTVSRGAVVTLSGLAIDPEEMPLTYSWRQTAGPNVSLQGADTPTAIFTAPGVPCDLEFSFSASDGGQTATDRVVVHVANRAPVVNPVALSPSPARTLDDITATASASDADGDAVVLSYSWTRNGVVIPGRTAATLPAMETTKNDVITVTVTASDGFGTASRQQSLTIQDTPPSFSVSPPSSVTRGSTISFQIQAEDPDGDPIGGYSVQYGPAGLTVSAGGLVSWTASIPMLDTEMDVRWGIGVAGVVGAALSGVFEVAAPGLAPAMRRTGIEIPINASGLVVADLDGDGDTEMLVGSNLGVYELSRSGSGYAQVWMYPFSPGDSYGIGAVAAADLDGDGKKEIFFSTGDLLVKLDGASRRESARLDSDGAFYCVDLELADLDRDGDLELVCLGAASSSSWSDTAKVVVLDAATLAIEWQSLSLELGRSLALGQVDGDAALEIVTAGGFVFDGDTGANEWAYSGTFGDWVDTGDLDGDGTEEIVGAFSSVWPYAVKGFSALSKGELWTHTTTSTPRAVLLADVDADGRAEVLLGDEPWEHVTAYDYVPATSSLSEIWKVRSPDDGITSLGLGDVDGDGDLEFVWGSGATSTGPDAFVVAGKTSRVVEWTNADPTKARPTELDPPFVGGRLARLGAGTSALLFAVAETNSGYAGSRLVALDPATGLLSVSKEIGSNWDGTISLAVADYDGDGVDEAFLTTASYYDGYFTVYDYSRDLGEWTSPTDIGNGVAVTHGDLTGDGFADLVAITDDGYVYAFDPKNQTIIWKSPSLGVGVDVAVADVDADGTSEIVALSKARAVVLKKSGNAFEEQASLAISGATDLLVTSALSGATEVYVLHTEAYYSTSSVLRLDGALTPLGSIALGAEATSLDLEDLPSARNLVVGIGSMWSSSTPKPSFLRAIDAVNGAEVWRSPPLAGRLSRNSVWYADTNGDGAREISFATSAGMYLTR